MKKLFLALFLLLLLAAAGFLAYRILSERALDRELEAMGEREKSFPLSAGAKPSDSKAPAPRFPETALEEEGADLPGLYAGKDKVFITADAGFELFRRFAERASDGIYGTFLYDQFASLFVDLMENLEERYEKAEGEDRMMTRNALLFSAICVRLCMPDARVPIFVLSDTEAELKLIREASFIGEKDGRPCDYTVYASFSENAGTPWGGAALLRAFLERRFFSLDDEEDRKVLFILAETLFKSKIAAQNYAEAARFLKAFDGETRVMTVKELWDLCADNSPASSRGAGLSSLAEDKALLEKIRPAAVTSFDAPPWRDPAQIAEPSPRVWFFQPALSLTPRTFRELHRWVVQPRAEHLLYVLGVAVPLPNSEELLLEDLKKEVGGHLGLTDRAVAAAALLKEPERSRAPALLVRSMLYTAEKPEEQAREAEWPKIKAVFVEDAGDFFRALSGLVRELNELYTDLDLFRVMNSYKKNALTPDRLLEAEQIFQELADMSRECASAQSGDAEALTGERAVMNARRFLTLLNSQKTLSPPWDKETALALEYNFQKVSLAGLRKPRLVSLAVPGQEGNEYFYGVRYQFYERESEIQEQQGQK